MPERSAFVGRGHITLPGDPAPFQLVRRAWNAMAVAAPAPSRSPGAPARLACTRSVRPAQERNFLLPVVLEHAPRRGLRALDAEWASAAVRPRVAVLSGPRRVLER